MDAIDGGAGVDTLSVVSNGAFAGLPLGATVKNIESIAITSASTVTLDATAAGVTGETSILAISATGQTITADNLTDVTSIESGITAATGDVTILGGKNVSLTVTGTITEGGDAGAEITVGSATKPVTGTVDINNSFAGADMEAQADIFITGGTIVTVTETLSNAVNTANTAGFVTVVGSAVTTSVKVTQDAAATKSATVVGKENGAVTVTDVNATSGTAAGTISTVTLSSFGASTIDSSALTTVTLSGTGVSLGIGRGALTATPTANTLALNVSGLTTTGAITDIEQATDADDGFTTINIASTTTATTIADLIAADATTINVSGDAALTLTDNSGLGALTSVVVTNTAGVTFGTTALGAGVTFTGSTGNDSVILSNAFTKVIAMGAGNDTVTYGGAAGTGGSVSAGDGTDTIIMTATEAAGADNDSVFNAKFTGFEVLQLGDSGANTIVLAGINGVNSVTTSAATGLLVLDGFSTGGTLKLTANVVNGGSYQANVNNATFNASDVFNINLSKTGGVLEAGSVRAAGVETVNITAADAASAGSTAVKHTLTLAATSATTINVSGNNGLALLNTTESAVTKFDATGVVANGTADTAALLAVSYTSANNTTTATVTITGGAGADTLVGGAAKDIITGGLGADVLAGGIGADTIIAGTGRDTIQVLSSSDTTAPGVSESTTAASDSVSSFKLATSAIAAANYSSLANFTAAVSGGADLSLLSINLTADGDGAGINLVVAVEGNGTGSGQATGVTYTVASGLLTLSGAGASAVDTLAEWLTEAAAVSATAGETVAFNFGNDTYVFSQNSASDVLVQLVGVTGSSLVLASASTTAAAGAIIIADGY
jgi:S-layer protein